MRFWPRFETRANDSLTDVILAGLAANAIGSTTAICRDAGGCRSVQPVCGVDHLLRRLSRRPAWRAP